MKAKQFITICLFLLVSSILHAQEKTVTGRVTGPGGDPLSGVTVLIKKTNTAVVTDEQGSYAIKAAPNAVLVFSFIGYLTKEVPVKNETDIPVVLQESNVELTGVVVTALGIKRAERSLTYSTQSISGSDLVKAKDVNPMNNLIGKVSGLQINRSSSGIGGSVSIVLRGLKSNRSNQPLYVIDGLPVVNTAGSGTTGPFGGNTDRGDILSSLNPDDIQSINVLKGASASALYGSQGANGAIMITTKKGAAGTTKIDVSSTVMIDQAFYLPKLQYAYGQSASEKGDAEDSWGKPGSYQDHVKDFFNLGATFINSIALSGGTEKSRNYFSYANTSNKGVMPTNTFKQHSLSFRNSAKFFNDKLTFDGSLMYAFQDVHNRPSSGLYFNPLSGLYMFPRGLDFNRFKNEYQYLSPTRNLLLQNWFNINADAGLGGTHHSQNPYWILNKIPTDQSRHSLIGAASLKYDLNDWLSISTRGTLNRVWNKFERKVAAGTQGVLSGQTTGGTAVDNGRYIREEIVSTNKYGDLLLIGNRDLSEDLSLNFTVGTAISDLNSYGWNLDARQLTVANGFSMANLSRKDPINALTEVYQRSQTQSLFASANLGFKKYLFLDLTGRNDWSSTLASTPNEKQGFFYYSAGIAAVLSDLLHLQNNYSKLRLSYAQVGNGVGVFVSQIPEATMASGNIVVNNAGVYNDIPLKPEVSNSWELGYEGRFIDNRLTVDLALYKTNTKNQFFTFQGPLGLLNTTVYLNAGDVENKGIELAVNYNVIKQDHFNWSTGVNYTANRNKVLELHPRLTNAYPIGNFNVLRVGGSFGDFWGKTFLRDASGKIVADKDGTPLGSVDGYIGSSNPKALVGWNNSFTLGKVSLDFTIDGRFGGQVISITQGYLNSFGVSKISADQRESGVPVDMVTQDGKPVTNVPAQKYYQGIGNRDGIIEGEVYDATNIRLRQLSVAYHIPVKSTFIKNASISLVGRNLFFFKNSAPYDPELSTTTATGTDGGQGLDSFGPPTTRSFGLNLNLGF
ncbi:SusC/RagA family TonB-linked outer membrane protein [Niabella beijingensis]|uniref:SusC/RagA family TonB-linked outer membrane protein n=1 Tax=Niabella beijingensis TaxID=2872700 RepID=UPI001CBC0444|nr:SusC/RagA family TonB-linked outer membrane protein [Niabella beijingensis]MBZ4187327.1 SusC/RagA family TonB-linked outer membrane protein [Niabella beijingensis]